jgi:hypothetical protein
MSIDTILDMSFDQIKFAAEVVYRQKIQMLEMVFEPIASMFGAKPDKKDIKPKKNLTPEERKKHRDAKLMWQIGAAGLKVEDL